LSRQLDKQQPAQDNSCLAPIFLKSEPTPSAPKNPLGARSCHWPTFGHTNFDAQNVGLDFLEQPQIFVYRSSSLRLSHFFQSEQRELVKVY
jgi:hypothetical protein